MAPAVSGLRTRTVGAVMISHLNDNYPALWVDHLVQTGALAPLDSLLMLPGFEAQR